MNLDNRWLAVVIILASFNCKTSRKNNPEPILRSSSSNAKSSARIPRTTLAASFTILPVTKFSKPWAMTFLPDGQLLVTEKRGALKMYDVAKQQMSPVTGVPEVDYGGQGGLGDIILHPDFADNQLVYLSWAEAGKNNTRGAAVGRGRLQRNTAGGGSLSSLTVIWRQSPKVSGRGHYGHRLGFDAKGFLFISSGERQKLTPAQDMKSNLGKMIRINDDGSIPKDNPFFSQGGVTAAIWSLGHRNPLGLAFDAQGRLWEHEMGPRGGDEINLIEKGQNYGWPVVSNGDHYSGKGIPDHPKHPEFNPPEAFWNPSISPAGFTIYNGSMFPRWKGNGFIGGLSSRALIRITLSENTAKEAQRWDMGQRIREVEQGPDGAIWILEDDRGGRGGRLLKLTPPTREQVEQQ